MVKCEALTVSAVKGLACSVAEHGAEDQPFACVTSIMDTRLLHLLNVNVSQLSSDVAIASSACSGVSSTQIVADHFGAKIIIISIIIVIIITLYITDFTKSTTWYSDSWAIW